MKRSNKQVCVIGLGHFGGELARALARHCEVLALDSDMHRVDSISDEVQGARCLDARDHAALASVVSAEFDEGIVSIGEGLEASILCTLHLKRIGVPVIRAKANSEDHADILRSVGATHVIFPERETARRIAAQILNPNLLDFIPLAEDYQVMDVRPAADFHGRSLGTLQLRGRFGVFVIAVKQNGRFLFLPGPDHVVQPSEVLVMIGREKDLLRVQSTERPPMPAVEHPNAARNGAAGAGSKVAEPQAPAPSATEAPPATAARSTGDQPEVPAKAREQR